MLKLYVKIDLAVVKAKAALRRFMEEEQGDFGVSQIAMIVVSVVIIGTIFMTVRANLPDLFDTFWSSITGWFDDMQIMTDTTKTTTTTII